MKILDQSIENIISVREQVLGELISKIEKRPAEYSDAKNLILEQIQLDILTSTTRVFYKNIYLGNIIVSFETANVSFIPYTELDNPHIELNRLI